MRRPGIARALVTAGALALCLGAISMRRREFRDRSDASSGIAAARRSDAAGAHIPAAADV